MGFVALLRLSLGALERSLPLELILQTGINSRCLVDGWFSLYPIIANVSIKWPNGGITLKLLGNYSGIDLEMFQIEFVIAE